MKRSDSRKGKQQSRSHQIWQDPRTKGAIGFALAIVLLIVFVVSQRQPQPADVSTIVQPASIPLPAGCPRTLHLEEGKPLFEPQLLDPQWRESYPLMMFGDRNWLKNRMYPCLVAGAFTGISSNSGIIEENDALTGGRIGVLMPYTQIALIDGFTYGEVVVLSNPDMDEGHVVVIEWYNRPRPYAP